MVIDQAGELYGTVGGGCGEAEVYETALQMLADPDAPNGCILHVDLTENPDDGGGKVCGGRFDVLLHRFAPTELKDQVEIVVRSLQAGETSQWQTSLGLAQPGFWKSGQCSLQLDLQARSVGGLSTQACVQQKDANFFFEEPLGLARCLVIVGAGHIARPLCAMASLAGYRVSVLDDRAEYALPRFFPAASEVVHGEYEDELPKLTEGSLVSVVLVTRGHRHDQDCLRLLVGHDLEYVGMIGSQRRIDPVFADLVSEGASMEWLRAVCAPIGLDIGAQTPGEIAVCILAEMIARRRGDAACSRTVQSRERHIRSLSP